MLSDRQPALSLVNLAWLYLLVALVLYGGMAWLTHSRLNELQSDIDARLETNARNELVLAVDEFQIHAQATARRLADWNEVAQQLRQPEYYNQWRADRLRAGNHLPESVVAAELYDADGRALAEQVEPPLGGRVPTPVAAPVLIERGGYVYLLAQAAVRGDAAGRPLGFVTVAFDFVATLGSRGRFAQLEPAGLAIDLRPESEVSIGQALSMIDYGLVPDAMGGRFSALLERYMYQVLAAAAALTGVLYIVLWYLVVVPLRRLTLYVDRLRGGDPRRADEANVPPLPLLELEKVRRSVSEYQSTLEVVNSGLSRKNRRLWKMAHHDPLTGCPNRRAFEDDWSHLLSIVDGRAGTVSLMLVDCDHFKAINDSYGHEIGDRVLRNLAVTLQRNLRPGDRVYRLGADEFAVMFMDCGAAQVESLAQQCQQAVRQIDTKAIDVRESLRVSIGLGHASGQDARRLNDLYRHANVAMYNAKMPGGSKVVTYSESLEGSARTLLSTRAAHALDEALASGKNLCMYYQPVVSTRDHKTSYYEALVRIVDEELFIPPDHFLPLVESRHLEVEFDHLILKAILQDLEQGLIPRHTGVSVNMSGATVISPGIVDRLAAFEPWLEQYRIVLEVTETAMITQMQVAAETLSALRARGFLIALDDFGSGYSSLRYLADMPVDVIKFDISLVQALCEQGPRTQLMNQLVNMVKAPGYQLVAEGIEDERVRQTMIELGFDYLQGFLLGEPKLPARLQQEPVVAEISR